MQLHGWILMCQDAHLLTFSLHVKLYYLQVLVYDWRWKGFQNEISLHSRYLLQQAWTLLAIWLWIAIKLKIGICIAECFVSVCEIWNGEWIENLNI